MMTGLMWEVADKTIRDDKVFIFTLTNRVGGCFSKRNSKFRLVGPAGCKIFCGKSGQSSCRGS